METGSTTGSSTNQAQAVQFLQNVLRQRESEMEDQHATALANVGRSRTNALSNEITQALSDVMSTMKKTGDEVRNSGR